MLSITRNSVQKVRNHFRIALSRIAMASQELLMFFLFVITVYNAIGTKVQSDPVLHRTRRQFVLTFPNSTLLQFNAGIGTPTAAKDINMNFAFQANFQLPWNRTQIPNDILLANSGYDGDSRRRRSVRDGDYQNNAKLFHFYKYVEEVLTGFGHDGKSCVRRALCQIGAEPLHSENDDDLLHELASFVLNPTHDADDNSSNRDESYPYIKAYRHGQNGKDCAQLYSKCQTSLVDTFSKLYDVS